MVSHRHCAPRRSRVGARRHGPGRDHRAEPGAVPQSGTERCRVPRIEASHHGSGNLRSSHGSHDRPRECAQDFPDLSPGGSRADRTGSQRLESLRRRGTCPSAGDQRPVPERRALRHVRRTVHRRHVLPRRARRHEGSESRCAWSKPLDPRRGHRGRGGLLLPDRKSDRARLERQNAFPQGRHLFQQDRCEWEPAVKGGPDDRLRQSRPVVRAAGRSDPDGQLLQGDRAAGRQGARDLREGWHAAPAKLRGA